MRTQADRLKWARKKAGYTTAAEAARAMGVKVPSYNHHENGTRGLKRVSAERYAQFFKVDLGWLLSGKGAPNRRFSVPVMGYVGAGAEVVPFDEVGGEEIDRVDVPIGDPSMEAVRVRGDSMYPVYAHNNLIFYSREPRAPGDCIGREAIVRLRDGRRFLKLVNKGSAPGRFTLVSYNAPPIVDVEVDWAIPVEWVQK